MPPLTQKNEIEKAMERKEKAISHFQASKEEGMKRFAVSRDATMIVTARMAHRDMTDEEIKDEIRKWNKWLWDAIYDAPFIN